MRLSLFLLLCLNALTACGQQEVHRKNYRFFIGSEDKDMQRAMNEMIVQYNQTVGAEVFHIVHDADEANSTVEFSKDMRKKDGKIGFGTWYTHSSDSSDWMGMNAKVEIDYSMRLQFDEEYVKARLNKSPNDPNSKEMFLLFCHEAGHGLTMQHVEDPDDVMHPTVYWQDSMKMDEYFAKVRAFFE